MSDKKSVQVRNVTLSLPVLGSHARKSGTGVLGGRLSIEKGSAASVVALNNVSFDVEMGERIGLVGRNGAGKSSLLRLLGGIYEPSTGTVSVQGRISTLFTSSAGLSADATGRENIFLVGRLLGISRSEMRELFGDIAEYSELGAYLDLPIRTYSAGMRTRLGFAIVTAMEPEVLLIDEVFGVGDHEFQKKARRRINKLAGRSNCVILASHAEGILRRFCTRLLWLEHGQIVMDGPVDEVLDKYLGGQSEDKTPSRASAAK